MGAVTIKNNGQRLKLTAVKVHEDGSDITAYSNFVGGSAISLPLTITSDYTLYVEDGSKTLTITQEDGTAYPVQRVEVQTGLTQVVSIVPDFLTVLADFEAIKGPVSGALKSGVAIGSAGITLTVCTGTPEAAVTAPVGSLALRTDGSTSTTLYVKTSGTGNTGWTAK